MSETAEIKVARFVVFCLEAYKCREAVSAAEAVDQFIDHGVIDYLRDGYDVLHTLGEAALVDEIVDFLEHRGTCRPGDSSPGAGKQPVENR